MCCARLTAADIADIGCTISIRCADSYHISISSRCANHTCISSQATHGALCCSNDLHQQHIPHGWLVRRNCIHVHFSTTSSHFQLIMCGNVDIAAAVYNHTMASTCHPRPAGFAGRSQQAMHWQWLVQLAQVQTAVAVVAVSMSAVTAGWFTAVTGHKAQNVSLCLSAGR